MTRKIALALTLMAAPALGGCALQAAMAAAQLAQHLPKNEGPSNLHLRPQAEQACKQHAAQFGTVQVIDIEQRRADQIVVWGSVTDAQQKRRTFECLFTTKLANFKLREMGA